MIAFILMEKIFSLFLIMLMFFSVVLMKVMKAEHSVYMDEGHSDKILENLSPEE